MHWVSASDTYLSGWGESEGRTNIFMLECVTPDEVMFAVDLLQKRAEMKNITIHDSETMPYADQSKFKVDLRNRQSAPAWYPTEPTQEEKYVAEGGLLCPQCGSAEINGGSLEVDCCGVTQDCTCTACGAFWKDHYALTGFSMIEGGKKHG